MTDAAAPRSSVARFGVAMVGPTFTWAWLEPDAEGSLNLVVKEKDFRAHPGLSFEEFLQYTQSQAMVVAMSAVAQKKVVKLIEDVSAEGQDPDEQMAKLEALAVEQAQHERERWPIIVGQVLMLVAPVDRDELRPKLEGGHVTDVRLLKEYLASIVIDRITPEVEVAGGVDPTSPE